jgi:hypothetical protein
MTNGRHAPARRGPSLRRRIVYALIPVAAVLLLAEIVVRIGRAPFHFGSFRELRLDLLARNYPAVRHPLLGYAPRPDYASSDNHWRTAVSIDSEGLRRNGNPAPPAGAALVVAVGDSFTFGDQVDDDATWPAWLERLLERPVLNGGVFGYSLAQAVLRAELLLERPGVDTLIVSFVADDLVRCEFSKRYTSVPWFDFEGEGLVLRNSPVTEPALGADSGKAFKDFLGHSALVDVILASTLRRWWFENEKQVAVPHLVGRGTELGKRLVDRIDARCRERGIRLLLLAQGDRVETAALEVLRHAESRGIATLDLATRFVEANRADPSLFERWFEGHMTREGNRWAAEQIAGALRALR